MPKSPEAGDRLLSAVLIVHQAAKRIQSVSSAVSPDLGVSGPEVAVQHFQLWIEQYQAVHASCTADCSEEERVQLMSQLGEAFVGVASSALVVLADLGLTPELVDPETPKTH